MFDAKTPIMNGTSAEPACPKPAIQAMHPVRIQGGRIQPAWFITIGYVGPTSRPMKLTATASAIRDGISQTICEQKENKVVEHRDETQMNSRHTR